MKKFKKSLSILLAGCLMLTSFVALAESDVNCVLTPEDGEVPYPPQMETSVNVNTLQEAEETINVEDVYSSKIWEEYGFTQEEFDAFPESLRNAMLYEPEEIGVSFEVPTREDIKNWKKSEAEKMTVNEIYVPIDAAVGTEYDLGNGLKYKVIDKELYDEIAADVQTEAMKKITSNVISIQSLSGTQIDETFKLTSTYKYWHIAMCNNQSTSYSTLLAIFDPNGELINSVRVQGGGSAGALGWIYSETAYPEGKYTVRFSSVYTLSGSAYGKIGTQASDVVYDG